jgi:hypothetical protein
MEPCTSPQVLSLEAVFNSTVAHGLFGCFCTSLGPQKATVVFEICFDFFFFFFFAVLGLELGAYTLSHSASLFL